MSTPLPLHFKTLARYHNMFMLHYPLLLIRTHARTHTLAFDIIYPILKPITQAVQDVVAYFPELTDFRVSGCPQVRCGSTSGFYIEIKFSQNYFFHIKSVSILHVAKRRKLQQLPVFSYCCPSTHLHPYISLPHQPTHTIPSSLTRECIRETSKYNTH